MRVRLCFAVFVLGLVVATMTGAYADVYTTYDNFGDLYDSDYWIGSPTIEDLGGGITNLSSGNIYSKYVNRSTSYNITWRVQWYNNSLVGYNADVGIKDNGGIPLTNFLIFMYAGSSGDGYVQAKCANSTGASTNIEGMAGVYLGAMDGDPKNDWLRAWHNITLIWENDVKVEWWVDGVLRGGCNASSNTLNIPDPQTSEALEIYMNAHSNIEVVLLLDWVKVDRPFAYESAIISPLNDTYTSTNVNLTWATNSSLQKSTYDCSVTIDGDANDTYTDVVNNTDYTITMTGLDIGAHNVTVNCYDGFENATDTEYFTTESVLELSISNPTNTTYIDSDLTFTYLANTTYPPVSTINCTVSFDDVVNTTYNSNNNTAKSLGFRELNATYHNVSVNCYDGNENLTRITYYTMDDVNYTVTQDASGYETSDERFNVTVGINPDIVRRVENGFFWNNINQGYDSLMIKDALNNRSSILFRIPITNVNNTVVPTHWNITKVYVNGSTYEENTTNTNYNVSHNYFLSASYYIYDILEGNATNHIRINVTKLNNLDLATISPVLNWNGSPVTMILTINKTGYNTYLYNESSPFLDSSVLNITNGFNITINVSATTEDVYYSRSESNSSFNYTQLIHNVQLVNCSIRGISALNFTFKDENSKAILRADADYNFTFDYSQEKIGFNELNNTNNTYCLFPHWFNDSMTAVIRYDESNTYTDFDRNYYLQNVTLNNITSNYYLLLLDGGSNVVFSIKDGATNDYVINSLIQALKYNDVLDTYELTGEGVTDDYGSVSIYLELNKVYRIIVYWEGATYIQKILVTSTSHSLIINPLDIEAWYNHTTRPTVEFNYSGITNYSWIYVIDNDGSMNSATLLVRDVTIGRESTLCDVANFTAGSFYIFCFLGNTSDRTYHAYATVTYEDGFSEIIYSGYFNLGVPTAWANNGVIVGIFIVLLFSMAGVLIGGVGVLLFTWFGLLINVVLNFWAIPFEAVAVMGLVVGILFFMKGRGD